MSFHIVADHAVRPRESDVIFGIASRAKEAIDRNGPENIINSTIGALLDDNGNLITFNTVYDTLKNMDNAQIASYSSLAGDPDFLDKVVEACFMDHRPEGYIKAVATPGGTGANPSCDIRFYEYWRYLPNIKLVLGSV